jgi:hypothetical protein
VRKAYQNQEIDTSGPAVPERVSVALGELAGELREGLLALAVGTGLQVMAAIMEGDVAAACGPKGRHDPERAATRHGHGAGSVTLGGRRVPVERPRMRATDGSGELPIPAYELFSDTEGWLEARPSAPRRCWHPLSPPPRQAVGVNRWPGVCSSPGAAARGSLMRPGRGCSPSGRST